VIQSLSLVCDQAAADFNDNAPGAFQDGLHDVLGAETVCDAW
jgi:hypothetical protein